MPEILQRAWESGYSQCILFAGRFEDRRLDPQTAFASEGNDERCKADEGADHAVGFDRDGMEDQAGTAVGQGI